MDLIGQQYDQRSAYLYLIDFRITYGSGESAKLIWLSFAIPLVNTEVNKYFYFLIRIFCYTRFMGELKGSMSA